MESNVNLLSFVSIIFLCRYAMVAVSLSTKQQDVQIVETRKSFGCARADGRGVFESLTNFGYF